MAVSREVDKPRGVNLLDLTPVQKADWREVEGRVVVIRPRPPRPWRAPLEWLAQSMAPKRLRLDEVGSLVWKKIDGSRTAGEVAAAIRTEFGDGVEPAEERLGKMLHVLRREGLIDF